MVQYGLDFRLRRYCVVCWLGLGLLVLVGMLVAVMFVVWFCGGLVCVRWLIGWL